jgi:YVTN family beta-propeller protein
MNKSHIGSLTSLISLQLVAALPALSGQGSALPAAEPTSARSEAVARPVSSNAVDSVPATYFSPAALAVAPDGKFVFVACSTARQIAFFDTEIDQVTATLPVPETPSGLALSKNGKLLYAVCAAPRSVVCVIDVAARRITAQIPAGHTAMAPVLSADETTLYVCNRFDNDIAIIDLAGSSVVGRVKVGREPVAAALTPDGKKLLVANHLQKGLANDPLASAPVSVIDTVSRLLIKDIYLTLGASMLNGVAISPDGQFAVVTHLRSMH